MLRLALLFIFCAPLCTQNYADHLSFGGISDDTAYGVACDSAGNSYGVYHFDGSIDVQPGGGTNTITGFFAGGVVKYDGTRTVAWAQVIEPLNPGDMVIPEMPVVDGNGNVYVVGRFFGQADFDPGPGVAIESAVDTFAAPTTQFNAFLLKLDATGAFQWVRVLHGDHTWGARVSCTDTHVCITGLHIGTNNLDSSGGTQLAMSAGLASFTVMFDSAGTQLWAQGNSTSFIELSSPPIIGVGNEVTVISSYGMDLTLTQGGTTYYPTGNVDMVITRYSASGAIMGVQIVGAVGANVVPVWAAPDGNGGYYVVGNWRASVDFDPGAGTTTLTPQFSLDMFVARYSAAGPLLWARALNCSNDTQTMSCAADVNGVVVAGSFVGTLDGDPGTATNTLYASNGANFVARIDSNGDHVWSGNLGAGSTGTSQVYGIASDGQGNVLLGGPYTGDADWDPSAATVTTTASAAKDGWVVWLNDNAATTPPPPAPLQIITTVLPTTIVGEVSTQTLTGFGGSGNGYQWQLVTGQLPPGVSGLPAAGTPSVDLAGIPSAEGVYQFTIQLDDDDTNNTNHAFTWVISGGTNVGPGPSPSAGACAATPSPTGLRILCALIGLAAARRRRRA